MIVAIELRFDRAIFLERAADKAAGVGVVEQLIPNGTDKPGVV